MAANTPAQLSFLTDAAHLLRQSAPETSAYLMSRRTELSVQQQQHNVEVTPVLTDVQRQHVCTCCGHIMVPGLDGTTIEIQTARRLDKTKKSAKHRDTKIEKDAASSAQATAAARALRQRTGIQKVIRCGCCGRDTRIALPPPAPLPKNRKKAAAADKACDPKAASGKYAAAAAGSGSGSATAAENTTASLSANANSKKRAKNRKAGLLAMLDKSRSSGGSSVGLGLTFNDFRKK